MPCSCQKNKTQSNLNAQTAAVVVNERAKATVIVPSYKSTVMRAIATRDSSYDFTPTTAPMDTCAYCAMKHIALATSLTDLNDYFSAAGLMQLASYHYNTANKELAHQCRDLARLFITKPKEATLKLTPLLREAMTYPALGDSKETDPGKLNYDPVASLVHLAAAQALVYTLIFYLQLNKAYAVGLLIVAAVNIQMHHRDIARGLRLVWKVIQLMQEPNDVHYKKAQLLLLDCKEKLYTVLRLLAASSLNSAVLVLIVDNTLGANAIPVN